MNRTEIIISGFGGQGIIFAGELLGRAAIAAGKEAAQSASYGSEARGSATHAGIIISNELVTYPKVSEPDILIAMSQDGYQKFLPTVKPEGSVFFDSNTVNISNAENERNDVEQVGFPSTANAERLGRKGIANVILLSYSIAMTKLLPFEALEEALKVQAPQKYLELNLKAMQVGLTGL